ncbi:MAG: hypothetical protein NTW26_06815 [bacterium]|nr:hypothetical protein [bacterium]
MKPIINVVLVTFCTVVLIASVATCDPGYERLKAAHAWFTTTKALNDECDATLSTLGTYGPSDALIAANAACRAAYSTCVVTLAAVDSAQTAAEKITADWTAYSFNYALTFMISKPSGTYKAYLDAEKERVDDIYRVTQDAAYATRDDALDAAEAAIDDYKAAQAAYSAALAAAAK